MVWSSKAREYRKPPRAAVEEKAESREHPPLETRRSLGEGRRIKTGKIFDADRERLR
jgi:hypothetical protein